LVACVLEFLLMGNRRHIEFFGISKIADFSMTDRITVKYIEMVKQGASNMRE
jgi:hypothetical protein